MSAIDVMMTLLHFLWQGTAIGTTASASTWLARNRSAGLRHNINLVALVACVSSVLATACYLHGTIPGIEESSVQPIAETETKIAASAPVMPTFVVADPTGEYPETTDERFDVSRQAATVASYVTAIYVGGVVLMLLRLMVGLWGGRRLCRDARVVSDAALIAVVDRQVRAIGLRVAPVVAWCDRTAVPMVVGVIKPVVLLPASLATGLSPDQLSAIIGHELAHIRRFDLLVNLFQRTVESLLFFHPTVWIISRRLSYERELCCDDIVLKAGCESVHYAGTLIRMAELYAQDRPAMREQVAALRATGNNQSELTRRVYRLLGASETPKLNAVRSLVFAAMVLIATVTVWAVVPTPDQQSADERNDQVEQPVDADTVVIDGTVVGPDGNPKSGVRVFAQWPKEGAETETNDRGQFELRLPYDGNLRAYLSTRYIRATADGGKLQAKHRRWLRTWESELDLPSIQLQLVPAETMEVVVLDIDRQPIPGAQVVISARSDRYSQGETDVAGRFRAYVEAESLEPRVYAIKDNAGFDYQDFASPRGYEKDPNVKRRLLFDQPIELVLDGSVPLKVTVRESDGSPIQGVRLYPQLQKKSGQPHGANLNYLAPELWSAFSDANGEVTFNWIPKWHENSITIFAEKDGYARNRISCDPRAGNSELAMTIERLVSIRGRVIMPDGSPAEGISISAAGASYSPDRFHGLPVKTDATGRYELMVAPNHAYMVTALGDRMGAVPQTNFAVMPGTPIDDLDFRLRTATRIYGRVVQGPAEQPVRSQLIQINQYGADADSNPEISLPNPEGSNLPVLPRTVLFERTDADGRFEYWVGPGKFDIHRPQENEIRHFKVASQEAQEFNFHIKTNEDGILQGQVVTGDPPEPVAGAVITGVYRKHLARQDMAGVSDESGKFRIGRELHRTVVHARSKNRTLAGVVEIEADQESIVIPVLPVATATGRLIDSATGAPMPDEEIVYGVTVYLGDNNGPYLRSFGGKTKTDQAGRFELTGLVQNQRYGIVVTLKNVEEPKRIGARRVGEIVASGSHSIDLGDLEFKPEWRAPTTAK